MKEENKMTNNNNNYENEFVKYVNENAYHGLNCKNMHDVMDVYEYDDMELLIAEFTTKMNYNNDVDNFLYNLMN